MKHILTAALLSLSLASPALAVESKEARLQLARMAVALEQPRDALLSGTNPLTRQPMFQQVFAQMNWAPVNEQAAQMMADMFTGDEIKALISFKQSEIGQSIALKMPGYQRLVGAMIQNEMKTTFETKVLPTQAGAGSFGAATTGAQRPAATPSLPLAPVTGGQGTPIKP